MKKLIILNGICYLMIIGCSMNNSNNQDINTSKECLKSPANILIIDKAG